jgi:MinD-like ATPase involved in chromosome partitioning or flagellar assembly
VTQRLRRELHPGPVVDGRRAHAPSARWRRRTERLLVSKGEREEAEVERLLGQQQPPSRPNVVAVVSPKGGVGKTTSAYVIGGLLADRLRLRVVALDANPDFGTLASLAPDRLRSPSSLTDVLEDLEQLHTATQLRAYVSALPTGLHLLAGPSDAAAMAELGVQAYGELVALLGTFYDLVLLDLGTGVASELAQFALRRADQVVLVTTPEWVTSSVVLAAFEHLEHEHTTVACNKFYARGPGDLNELERRLRERRLHHSIAIPHDEQLAAMLDTATYELDALGRPSRMAIKRLGLQVAQQLV